MCCYRFSEIFISHPSVGTKEAHIRKLNNCNIIDGCKTSKNMICRLDDSVEIYIPLDDCAYLRGRIHNERNIQIMCNLFALDLAFFEKSDL